MAVTNLVPPGWLVSEKYLSVLSSLPNEAAALTHLLNTDMREYGVPWLDSKKGKDVLDADGQVLQVVQIRNIAISQAEEDFQTSSDTAGGVSRLLKLTLTDGKHTISALDIDNSPKLSYETPPGTKIRLTGRIQVRVGFLILRRNNFDVLKGSVDSLYREWLLTRDARGLRRSQQTGPDAPPPFVPFGSPEASAMIDSYNQFLNRLRSRNRRPEDTFDSLKLAMNSTTKVNSPMGDDSDFQQRRREILAEAQSALSTGEAAAVQHTFRVGGSKFQQERVNMAIERDRNLAQLVSMGYQPHEASVALEEAKNNLEGAIDRLTSRQFGRSLDIRRETRDHGRGRRGGGGRVRGPEEGRGQRGRGPHFDIEDDPWFDPVAAAEQSGLRGKPSSGPVPLSEFMENPPPSAVQSKKDIQWRTGVAAQSASQSTRLPQGTILLAPVMSGEFEAARLIGMLPDRVEGEHVAVVSYLQGDEEHVPVSMLRTMEKGEVTADMLPVLRVAESPRTGPSNRGQPSGPRQHSGGRGGGVAGRRGGAGQFGGPSRRGRGRGRPRRI
uniref:UBA domain-containing protein n=1 Tax=Mesocestoides corti TaxID=53468 RepID=A0A5K3EG35_MESCO